MNRPSLAMRTHRPGIRIAFMRLIGILGMSYSVIGIGAIQAVPASDDSFVRKHSGPGNTFRGQAGLEGVRAIPLFAAAAPKAELRGPEPFLRELRTGYLINCTFRAIRPYLWKQTPRLTGWETDPSGGGWEATPSGFFPNEFGFHVESFRLREVFTTGGPHQDPVPTDAQKRRFTVLYPKE
jgi:hypothetical protein